jgi:type I restriction enzyme R subunit
MNEAATRKRLIDPKLTSDGWDESKPDVRVEPEYTIGPGKINASGKKQTPIMADYLLMYKSRKMAIVEAKSDELPVSEGVMQAKNYAERLGIDHTYSTNGLEIYYINMDSGNEGLTDKYLSPEEMWQQAFPNHNDWQKKFDATSAETKGGTMGTRFYQEMAIERALDAIANKENRILLTLATGTGKTIIAFQIAWKLFQSRWNLHYDGVRRPRILFLADRNILADQAFNAFSAFPDDVLVRINPKGIKKLGAVPVNGSIFFTIFQTFMSGTDKAGNPTPYFGEYPKDYFDLIFIDECHRGGANDESAWRGILEYFEPAVQIGLTATPKRKENVNTYKYFNEPKYIYSLKEGINDGYLTPFKVKRVTTSLDEYTYDSEDQIIEGEIEHGKTYKEDDFNKIIEIKAREEKRVKVLMSLINQNEKTLVFCATQEHAAAIRDLINQNKKNPSANYCVRVTANDGEQGEQYLRDFQDNEKSIPTILTTSRKLTTGVDARNVRNIVLMRPVKDMVEFKQIIGRGTRLYDDKNYFTIYDFVGASAKFKDPDWDGDAESCEVCGELICVCENEPPKPCKKCGNIPCTCEKEPPIPCKKCGQLPCVCIKKVKVKLKDGSETEITHSVETSFWGADGQPLSVQEFLNSLYGKLPDFFNSEKQLREIWSLPNTRHELLVQLGNAGFDREDLKTLQKLIEAEKCDLFDVLEYVAFSIKPITREERVASATKSIFRFLNDDQKEFVNFILERYVATGEEELDQEKLPSLLTLKYNDVSPEVTNKLGGISMIKEIYLNLQKELYLVKVA